MSNIYQKIVVPDKPKVLEEERIYVYMPTAGENKQGLASFEDRDFNVVNGHVKLRWPMQDLVENADPLTKPSFVKLIADEFVKTDRAVTANYTDTEKYASNKIELKLKRTKRRAFDRPDLVMLNRDDFSESEDANGYVKYNLKANNPLNMASIVKLKNTDFSYDDGERLVNIKWPQAHTGSAGLVDVDTANGYLKFDSNKLQVDYGKIKTKLDPYMNVAVKYEGETDYSLAERDTTGHYSKIDITKKSLGLSKVANKSWEEYVDEMERRDNIITEKLEGGYVSQATWNDTWVRRMGDFTGSDNADTVQKWFKKLESKDASLGDSIRTLKISFGVAENETVLNGKYPPNAKDAGTTIFVLSTASYWVIRPVSDKVDKYIKYFRESVSTLLNTIVEARNDGITFELGDVIVELNEGIEYEYEKVGDKFEWINKGERPDNWCWYNTAFTSEVSDIYQFVEEDADNIYPADRVASVSVGTSGKWIQSDHIHPSDPHKVEAEIVERGKIHVKTLPGSETLYDFSADLATRKIYGVNDELIEEGIGAGKIGVVENEDDLTNFGMMLGADLTAGQLAITRNRLWVYKYNDTDNLTGWIRLGKEAGKVTVTDIGKIEQIIEPIIDIRYIETATALHNWKGNENNFEDVQNEYYWAGTKEEYDAIKSNIRDNSLIIVEDEDILTASDILTKEHLRQRGFDFSVITNKLVKTTNTDRGLAYIDGNTIDVVSLDNKNSGKLVVDDNGLGTKTFNDCENKLLAVDDKSNVILSELNYKDVMRKGAGGDSLLLGNILTGEEDTDRTVSKLEAPTLDSLLVYQKKQGESTRSIHWLKPDAADDNNKILVYDDGFKFGMKMSDIPTFTKTNTNEGKLVVYDDNSPGELKISSTDFGSRLIIGDGVGGIRPVEDWAKLDRLIVTAENGGLTEFDITEDDVGKYLMANSNGVSWESVTQASDLPMSKQSETPTEDNEHGLKAVFLSAPLANSYDYKKGYIYFVA